MTEPLTDKRIQGLKPPATGREDHFDAKVPGLHLRISATGHRTWRYFYRVHGAQRVLSWPGILPLGEVRRLVKDEAGRIARGEDPSATKQAQRKAAKDAASVEALVERFLDTYLRPLVAQGKRSAAYLRETERLLRAEVLPVWGRRKAKDITRRDVKALLGDLVARPAPITANRTKAALSKFFNWCLDTDVLDASPALRLKAPAEEHERERVLSGEEIRRLWAAADATDAEGHRRLSPWLAALFRLRLLTAQRGGELAGMRWDEISEDGRWWTIPGPRAKNRRAHRVPLAPQARAILDALPRAGAFVFPGRTADRALRSITAAWAALVEAAGLVDAVPHDLRRTAASGMASLGVPRLVIGKVLNHIEPGVTRVYDRHGYDAEKQDALERWGRQVDAILAGARGTATVITLRPAPPAEAIR